MILHREDRQCFVPHSLQGLVVKVDLCQFDLLRIERAGIHRKTVILRGNMDFPRLKVFDRLISPPVAELQFKCLSAKSQPKELMSQADAKDRFLPDQFSHVCNGIRNALRVSRSIGKKDSIGFVRENRFRCGRSGKNRHLASPIPERAEDVKLYPEVHHGNLKSGVESGVEGMMS